MSPPFLHLYLWEGRVLLVKRGALAAPHQHMASQLVLAGEGSFRVARRSGPWLKFRAALWDGRIDHRFDGRAGIQATVYLEPQSPEGRAAAQIWKAGRGLVQLPFCPKIALQIRTLARNPSLAGAQALHQALCLHYLGKTANTADARLEAAILWLRAHLPAVPKLSELAAALSLSPDRVRHLFQEKLGIGPRRFVLWFRLIEGLKGLESGTALTRAAHQAGFSDSAHFTRTCVRMMGLRPGALLKHNGIKVFHSK